MDKIVRASKGARIINLSSLGYIASGLRDDWNFKVSAIHHRNLQKLVNDNKQKEAYNPWLAYAQSKTSNILFSSSLAKRLKSKAILVFSVNPGCWFLCEYREGCAECW
jgi:NAD(P)-dependent dehydrogenase (short-subunit alcohol dehydrogenase family)